MTDLVYKSAEGAAAVAAKYRRVLDQWPTPKTEFSLATRQGPTFVIACGPDNAPPIVLLHGSQANSAAWFFDVASWATEFRLFAVDMIGEPGFSARVRPSLADETHALWLDDVFAGLGLSRAALAGVSLGGWLALDYATRRPQAVGALALICPAGIGRQKNFLLKVWPLLLLGSWGQRKIREMAFGPAPETISSDMRLFGDLMETIGRVVRPRVVSIPQLTDAEIQKLAAPILAIIGGRDVLIDSNDTRARLKKDAPHAEICFLDDGYHFLPGQTARVMDFLMRRGAGDDHAARASATASAPAGKRS